MYANYGIVGRSLVVHGFSSRVAEVGTAATAGGSLSLTHVLCFIVCSLPVRAWLQKYVAVVCISAHPAFITVLATTPPGPDSPKKEEDNTTLIVALSVGGAAILAVAIGMTVWWFTTGKKKK